MGCKSCHSNNQKPFTSEICVHLSGLTDPEATAVFVFPALLVCLDCGFSEFSIPESELRLLTKGVAS